VFSRQWWLSLRGMPKKASFSASENARIREDRLLSEQQRPQHCAA
jgi:hypothetical protein